MSAPPRPLDGEKSEVKPGFFCYTAEVDVEGGGKGKKLSFWNATDNQQFKISYTFGDAEHMKKLHADVSKKDGEETYMLSLYPGEAKEMIQGRFKSSKRGIAFGPPDKAWQEKQAASITAHLDIEIAAVRAALKANPSKDGRYTAEYIASVCTKVGIPFVDLTFPPKEVSLFRDFEASQFALRNSVLPWKRPAEYCPKGATPALYVGSIEPSDLDQGRLGDCYLLSAAAAVAEFPEVIKSLFAVNRDLELGIVRMRACKNGWWTVVTVDDLVPMLGEAPVFAKNREEPNEIWPSIFEKVYAKLHGSYQAICKGDATHAVTDFLGAPYWKFKDLPEWEDANGKLKLFDRIVQWDQEQAVMTLGTPGQDPKHAGKNAPAELQAMGEKYAKAGLVAGHAFCLMGAKQHGGVRLIEVKNPWGSEHEWAGAYRDDDPAWTPELKNAFGWEAAKETNGLFFMPYEETWKWFETGSVSYLKCVVDWSSVRVAGNFEKGVPDVVLKVTTTGSKPVNVIVGIHQKDCRGIRPDSNSPDLKYLGYKISVLAQGADGKCAVHDESAKAYMVARDIFCQTTLKPRAASEPYFILPQCFGEDDKSFVLSVFLDSTEGVAIECCGYKEGLGKKINNGALFAPGNCSQKVAAQMQIMTKEMKLDWLEVESNTVDWANCVKMCAAKPKLSGTQDDKVDAAKIAAAMKRAEALAAESGAAAASSGPTGSLNFAVTCIGATGLEAKDANGKSDPYLVVGVSDKSKQTRGDIEAQTTKTQTHTLEPCWGDVFDFAVNETDMWHLTVYDSDIGEDQLMGEAYITVAELLGLKKGASKAVDVKLDTQGTVKLLFTMK